MEFYFNNTLGQVSMFDVGSLLSLLVEWISITEKEVFLILSRWLRDLIGQDDMQKMLDLLNDVHFFRATDTTARYNGCVLQYFNPWQTIFENDFMNKSIHTDPCRLMSPPTNICSPSGINHNNQTPVSLTSCSLQPKILSFQRRDQLHISGRAKLLEWISAIRCQPLRWILLHFQG